MIDINDISNREQQDKESALTLIKSLVSQIEFGNYNAALSNLGSLAIILASAESNNRIGRLLKAE